MPGVRKNFRPVRQSAVPRWILGEALDERGASPLFTRRGYLLLTPTTPA